MLEFVGGATSSMPFSAAVSSLSSSRVHGIVIDYEMLISATRYMGSGIIVAQPQG